jgi:hypothetical protein
MVVRRAGSRAIRVLLVVVIWGVDVPGSGTMVDDTAVVTLVASASTRALMERKDGLRDVFLLDEVHGDDVCRGTVLGCSFTSGLAGLVGSSHRGMEGGKVAHHTLILVLLVSMNGLGMLTEVI